MKKFLSLTLLGALLLSSCQGEDLQGRFATPTQVWTMELSTSSPSVSRSVSTNDDVLIFDMKVSKDNTLAIGSTFTVYFKTDSDLDPLADQRASVYLKVDGDIIGKGKFSIVDLSIPSEGKAVITTTAEVDLTAKTAKTFTVNTSTSDILHEDSGVDDEVTVSVEHNGKTVTGNTLRY